MMMCWCAGRKELGLWEALTKGGRNVGNTAGSHIRNRNNYWRLVPDKPYVLILDIHCIFIGLLVLLGANF